MVAGIGEVLWDVVGENETLGDAPINLAYHAGQLGAAALAFSSIGDDVRTGPKRCHGGATRES